MAQQKQNFFKNKKKFLEIPKNDKNLRLAQLRFANFISLKISLLKHDEMPGFFWHEIGITQKPQNETKKVSFYFFSKKVKINEVEVLQLTMAGEYTVRTMLHLAALPRGAVVQISEISRQWDIPENFLRKIVQSLVKSSLILSRRGIGGGIELAKPAENITLLEVVETAEGKMALNKCLVQRGKCHRDSWCAVHLVWHEAQERMKDILSSKSLADLAKQSLAQRARIPGQKRLLKYKPSIRWSFVHAN